MCICVHVCVLVYTYVCAYMNIKFALFFSIHNRETKKLMKLKKL